MHNILLQILEEKRENIEKEKKEDAMCIVKNQNSVFLENKQQRFIKSIVETKDVAIIAEIKIASPTHPFLGKEEEIMDRAIAYEKAGATAISYITEKHFFKGNMKFITELKQKVSLPILQKDFVIDEYQIYQAKFIGSDALLLIVRYLDQKTVQKFVSLCLEIGIEPVVEINDEEDLKKVQTTSANVIAVNARNVEDFRVNINTVCDIMKKIPDRYIRLGFSGIHSSQEVTQYHKAGAKGVLVGTELMKTKNSNEFMYSLRI